jgi:hypothetical protein
LLNSERWFDPLTENHDSPRHHLRAGLRINPDGHAAVSVNNVLAENYHESLGAITLHAWDRELRM